MKKGILNNRKRLNHSQEIVSQEKHERKTIAFKHKGFIIYSEKEDESFNEAKSKTLVLNNTHDLGKTLQEFAQAKKLLPKQDYPLEDKRNTKGRIFK